MYTIEIPLTAEAHPANTLSRLSDALAGTGAVVVLRDDDGNEIERRTTPRVSSTTSALDLHRLGNAVVRQLLPTSDPLFVGRARTIFGTDDPTRWDGRHVASVINVAGLIVRGLEHTGDLIARHNPDGLRNEARWLWRRLEDADVPRETVDLDHWPTFVAELSRLASS